MTQRNWPWHCKAQDPTHRGMVCLGDWDQPPNKPHEGEPPVEPRAVCVTYLADWDRAHPENPLRALPREYVWLYCVPETKEES
jgi:hypothetical protein